MSLPKDDIFDLYETIQTSFPLDEVYNFINGSMGRDTIHKVISRSGHVFGKIVWETMHTDRWSDTWVTRIKNHQRSAGAEMAVLVPSIFPYDSSEPFISEDDVLIVRPYAVRPIANVLRNNKIEKMTTG